MDDIGTFSDLNPAEIEWLDRRQSNLRAYVAALLPGRSHNSINAGLLDELWVAWKSSALGDNEAITSFVQSFGVGFGQLLVDNSGFEWAILADEYGTDFAVRALPGTANTRVAPIDFVLKRYDDGIDEFVVHAIQEIEAIVAKSADEWNDPDAV